MMDTNGDEATVEATVEIVAVDATIPKTSKKKSNKKDSSRKFVDKLLTVPTGTSLKIHYEKLKE